MCNKRLANLEPGIKEAVNILRDIGIETVMSCEGHEGKSGPWISIRGDDSFPDKYPNVNFSKDVHWPGMFIVESNKVHSLKELFGWPEPYSLSELRKMFTKSKIEDARKDVLNMARKMAQKVKTI